MQAVSTGQTTVVPAQVPFEHMSVWVLALASSQLFVVFVGVHVAVPFAAYVVQAVSTGQTTVVPAHMPFEHVSVWVLKLASSQLFVVFVGVHDAVPFAA